MAAGFHIERQRRARWRVLRLEGIFDGTSAWELRHALARMPSGLPVIVDFSGVTQLWEFGAALLAAGLPRRRGPPIGFMGLIPEQTRLLRRFGLDPEPPRPALDSSPEEKHSTI